MAVNAPGPHAPSSEAGPSRIQSQNVPKRRTTYDADELELDDIRRYESVSGNRAEGVPFGSSQTDIHLSTVHNSRLDCRFHKRKGSLGQSKSKRIICYLFQCSPSQWQYRHLTMGELWLRSRGKTPEMVADGQYVGQESMVDYQASNQGSKGWNG